jgi:hypothetical protein
MNYDNELIQIENKIDGLLSRHILVGKEWISTEKDVEVGSEIEPKDQHSELMSSSPSTDLMTTEGRDSYDERRGCKSKVKNDSNDWYVEWIENSFDKSEDGSRDHQIVERSNDSDSYVPRKEQLVVHNEVESITVEESANDFSSEEDSSTKHMLDEFTDDHDDSVDDDRLDEFIGSLDDSLDDDDDRNCFQEGDHDDTSFSSHEFHEDDEKNHLDKSLELFEETGLNDSASNLFSESLEKIMASDDELEDCVAVLETIPSVSSAEKRDRIFNSLMMQHDQLLHFHDNNDEPIEVATHQKVSTLRVKESSPMTRDATFRWGNNRLEKQRQEPREKKGSWQESPLNSTKQLHASNSGRSQTRACDRLYDLAVKKRDFNNERRKMKEDSEKVASTKSFYSCQIDRKSESSKPVYERLYSLAPKRPRQVKATQKRRWK